MSKNKIDWEAAEIDYINGVITEKGDIRRYRLREFGAKYGINHETVRKQAIKRNWYQKYEDESGERMKEVAKIEREKSIDVLLQLREEQRNISTLMQNMYTLYAHRFADMAKLEEAGNLDPKESVNLSARDTIEAAKLNLKILETQAEVPRTPDNVMDVNVNVTLSDILLGLRKQTELEQMILDQKKDD